MEETSNIELRSEEMQDILTRPPHILVRSGIAVICAVLLLLIVGTFFFTYPDKITGGITITTENPPVWLVSRTAGKIKKLYIRDKDTVHKDRLLAVIDNAANTEAVFRIKELLTIIHIADSAFFIPEELTGTYELGSIQNAYSVFLKSITDYNNFLLFNTVEKEKEALQLQVEGHKRLSASLKQQLTLKQEELQLSKMAYERERQLYQKGVISQAEMESAENAYLNTRQTYQQLQTTITSDQIELAQLEENIFRLDTQQAKEKNSLLSGLKTAYNELKTQIENWEQIYLLISPINGTVTLNTFWTQNQFVNTGDKVLAIVPDDQGRLMGRIQTPSQNAGKIKTGQKVNIKVDGYPYMEYGTLQGTVRTMSLISNETIYVVGVELLHGLTTTNTGKILEFTGELTGEGEIITDDRSLADRILSPLQYLFKNYTEKRE
jgi:HlyD family secretion protein